MLYTIGENKMIKYLKFLLFLGLFSFIASTTLAQDRPRGPLKLEPKKDKPQVIVPYGKEKLKEPPKFGKNMMSVKHKPITCGPKESLLKDLKNNWGELPLILAIEPVMMSGQTILPLRTMFFFNIEKGTFTVVQTPPMKDFKNQVCILTAGAIHHINKEVFNKLMGGITINF